MNFQRGLAELAGHGQGICFAVAMVIGGAEARKRKREQDRRQKLYNALKWTEEMSHDRFEEELSAHFSELEYRIEPISKSERANGFCLRVVRDGRTTLVHDEFWKASRVDEDRLAKLAETSARESLAADRVLLLTKAEVTDDIRKRMSARSWNVVGGTEFLRLSQELPAFQKEASPSQDNTDNKRDTCANGAERMERKASRSKGLFGLFRKPFHHYFMHRSVGKKR